MRRPGCNPLDVQMSDVLCDFCAREWSESLPMVEGHQGSCICGDCLREAYRSVVLGDAPAAGQVRCALCLEERADPSWAPQDGPGAAAGARACRRCVKQSAAVLQKDPDLGWRRPE
jgi:hypothetical protein